MSNKLETVNNRHEQKPVGRPAQNDSWLDTHWSNK